MKPRAITRVAARVAILTLWGASADAVPPGSKQATYDAAQAAFDKEDWATAAAGFATLLPEDPTSRLDRPHAVIAARLAEALVDLGRLDEARGWATRAVADLPAGDPTLADAWMAVGDAARFSFDYEAAIAAYQKAAPIADAAGDLGAVDSIGLRRAYAEVTVDPVHAAAELDTALARFPTTAKNKTGLAELEDLRARAALNAGDRKSATSWITRAVSHSGGLGNRVTFLQAGIRGDAALIYRLNGDDEQAREYLTYMGAGHMEKMDWVGRFDGEPPVCDIDGGVQPQDSAVVQFVLTEDGRVGGAIPVYASRSGDIGATFARAVSRWRWEPAALKGIDGFWRSTLRLELRCVSRPAPQSLGRPYVRKVTDWLVAKGLLARDAVLNGTHGEDVITRDGDGAIVRALFTRKTADSVKPPSFAEAEKLLDAAHAPPSAYALLVMKQDRSGAHASATAAERSQAAAMAPFVQQITQRFSDDPSAAWLTLEYALALEATGAFERARPLVQAVLATPETVLPADDPVRRVALLHNALILARLNDAGGARASLAQSGLDAGQCVLFDTHPIPQSVAIGSESFPQEAIRWRFEGYVKEAFDIRNDGHVANVRTIVAYPPFIFGPSTESATRSFRYVPPSIDGKAVGCSGQTQTVNYRLPG